MHNNRKRYTHETHKMHSQLIAICRYLRISFFKSPATLRNSKSLKFSSDSSFNANLFTCYKMPDKTINTHTHTHTHTHMAQIAGLSIIAEQDGDKQKDHITLRNRDEESRTSSPIRILIYLLLSYFLSISLLRLK